MSQQVSSKNPHFLSFLGLRKAIGIIGIAQPFVLWFGKPLLDKILQMESRVPSSVSGYYYTPMRDVFVGSLCALGVFLVSYKGYERIDDIAGDIACVSTIANHSDRKSPGSLFHYFSHYPKFNCNLPTSSTSSVTSQKRKRANHA